MRFSEELHTIFKGLIALVFCFFGVYTAYTQEAIVSGTEHIFIAEHTPTNLASPHKQDQQAAIVHIEKGTIGKGLEQLQGSTSHHTQQIYVTKGSVVSGREDISSSITYIEASIQQSQLASNKVKNTAQAKNTAKPEEVKAMTFPYQSPYPFPFPGDENALNFQWLALPTNPVKSKHTRKFSSDSASFDFINQDIVLIKLITSKGFNTVAFSNSINLPPFVKGFSGLAPPSVILIA